MIAFRLSRFIAVAIMLFALGGAALVASHLGGYAAPTLSGVVSGDDVQLSWSDASWPVGCTQAREYFIYRNNSQITSVSGLTTNYTDSDLANGTYAYKVQGKCNVPAVPSVSSADTNNLSAMSNIEEVTIASAPACVGAPTLTASANPMTLWPPNGKLVQVTVTGTISPQENCSVPENVSYWIADEYGDLSSPSPINVAVQDSAFTFSLSLEASRLGDDLDGRTYELHVSTSDGGYITGDVVVPHDQRKK
jgi:hypothetical protein